MVMSGVRKAIIAAAGSGTRLLPFSRETPKEMLPYCARTKDGRIVLKPILQGVYESLYDHGCREFCFVVSRGKRSIEDYFLADGSGGSSASGDLHDFYGKICTSHISYVQQPSPLGFGDAILRAKHFAGTDNILIHAGDDMILSPSNDHIRRLEDAFFSHGADLAFLVSRAKRPELYGVVEGTDLGNGVIRVERLEEKPEKPRSDLTVVATYVCRSSVFAELEGVKKDKNGEIHLADAIKNMVSGRSCIAVELADGETRMDVGTPENYAACIRDSLEISVGGLDGDECV